MPTFSGALMWHAVYPWPQRPGGMVEEGFKELARRWRPILDYAEECGVDCAYEVHPGEDLHDGASYEQFLDNVGGRSIPGNTVVKTKVAVSFGAVSVDYGATVE